MLISALLPSKYNIALLSPFTLVSPQLTACTGPTSISLDFKLVISFVLCTSFCLFFTQEGKPGLMELYEKRSRVLIGFGASMEWNQYVFIIKDQHLKYYRPSKVSDVFYFIRNQKFGYIETNEIAQIVSINIPFNQVS